MIVRSRGVILGKRRGRFGKRLWSAGQLAGYWLTDGQRAVRYSGVARRALSGISLSALAILRQVSQRGSGRPHFLFPDDARRSSPGLAIKRLMT